MTFVLRLSSLIPAVAARCVPSQASVKMDDPQEAVGLERCPAHQCAVDIRLGHQLVDIVRLDAAAVLDADLVGDWLVVQLGKRAANGGMYGLRVGWSRGIASADR